MGGYVHLFNERGADIDKTKAKGIHLITDYLSHRHGNSLLYVDTHKGCYVNYVGGSWTQWARG